MNEQKQIALTTKARRELKKAVNDGRYDVKKGFSFRDRSGNILDKQTIFSTLRGF